MNNTFARLLGVLLLLAVVVVIVFAVSVSRGPGASRVDDASLADQIDRRVHSDADLAAFDVRADVDHGVATLTGAVATSAQRERARQLAQVSDVTRVENRITVGASAAATAPKTGDDRGTSKAREGLERTTSALERAADQAGEKTREGLTTAGREITDAWILTLVKSHFYGEKTLKGSDINVDVDRHVVTLRGTVPSAVGHARAVDIAANIEGVARVVDHLSVAAGN